MDVEATIQFLLQQQAAAEARWAESETRTDRWKADFETKMTALATRMDGIAAHVDGLATRMDGIAAHVDGLATRVEGIATQVEGITAQVNIIATQIVKLNNSQVAIQETQFKQLEMINALTDAQVQQASRSKEIDERLNALIAIVDDMIRRKN